MKRNVEEKRKNKQASVGQPKRAISMGPMVKIGVLVSLTVWGVPFMMSWIRPLSAKDVQRSPEAVGHTTPWAFSSSSSSFKDSAKLRDRARPDRAAPNVSLSSKEDTIPSKDVMCSASTAPSTSPSDQDQGSPGVTLLPRFALDRDPMERMQADVACTAVCTVQAVVAPKAYLTIHLNAQDRFGRVSLDDPQGWAVKGYYGPSATGHGPILRVEDTGTLNGHPPAATWLRIRTTTRSVDVHLTPEGPGTIALTNLHVNDANVAPAEGLLEGWFQTLPGNAGL